MTSTSPRRWSRRSVRVFATISVVALAIAGLVFGGCGEVPEPAPTPELDREQFRREIEPILFERCGNPTTCHGDRTRPFALYVPNARRRDPADVHRDPPLTDTEHRANYDRTRSFARDCESGCPLLSKPLDVEHSGVRHLKAGAIFESRRNRAYQTLLEWTTGGRP